MSNKMVLRQALRAQRLSLSSDLIALYSQEITTTLLTLTGYQDAKHIGCYVPTQNEVNLHSFIQQAWRMQKNTYLPVLHNANEMDFYTYTSKTDLIKNKYDIDEPNILTSDKINPVQLDLLLIPLVAFDIYRNRLGQGVGFYDRYLAHYLQSEKKPITVGIGYEFQKIDQVPTDVWDIALNVIVSEKQIY